MKKHTVLATLNLCIIVFFKKSFCLDPWYEACVPKTCEDGMHISYPFFINGLQDPSCGYPGFELRCSNGSSVIRISENDYLVKQIDYDQRSMWLVNVQDVTNCLTEVRNLTLEPNRFTIDNNSTTELVFLRNCTKILTGDLTRYRIASCNPAIDQLVMLRNDTNLGMGMERCGDAVSVPVGSQDEEGRNMVVDGGNYEEVMRREFTVQWRAADCGVCEWSGGRCGFNMTAFQFRCFCHDRPRKVSCRTAFSVGVATILVVIILCFVWKFKWKRKIKNHLNVETFLKDHEFLARKSYGVMILEMVGGRRNIDAEVDHTSEIYFPHWIYKKVELQEEQLGLHGIVSDEVNEMAKKMVIVGLWCIQTNPLSRPTITRVLEMLGEDLASLEIPPKPYLCSPPRSMASTSTD
ncbi:hypothetical protein L1987_16639 [Smallanthus sonchifolius]|uniref:Uncharacterized protein n=1 Tax=Smallanthus sonchifolius TaxID=185202 RepID=A0ACB9IVR7_9ASTR|nr:hypothetical protein L1987_16639 [Smallanthus sonchifolius]